jgi:hypothetical protein
MRATTLFAVTLLSFPSLAQQPNKLLVIEGDAGFGVAIAVAGDVDADGVDDLLVSNGGRIFVHSGAIGQLLHTFFIEGYALVGLGDLDGDGHDDFAIGSQNAIDGGGLDTGGVFVYSGADFSLLYQVFGQTHDQQFGFSIASAGDVDGDGKQDLLVGAPGTNQGPPVAWAGGAFLHSGSDGTLIRAYNGTLDQQRMGYSVANAGDLDGDGIPDQVFGAPYASNWAGRASTYSGSGGNLLAEIDGATFGDIFLGYSVAGIGDGRILVGAPGLATQGTAYLAEGGTGAILMSLFGGAGSQEFGHSVSRVGDFDHDGIQDLLIGAPRTEVGGSSGVGRATIHSGLNGSELARFDGEFFNSWLGFAVAAAGDHDGDGLVDILVCALNQQAVFLVGFNPYLHASQTELSASLGASVNLELSFPFAAALDPYKVLISASGPGPTLHGVEIPLTRDATVIDSYFGNYPIPVHLGLHGSLDSAGHATASFDVPAGLPASLIGRQFWMAAIVEPSGMLPTHSSVGVVLTVVL